MSDKNNGLQDTFLNSVRKSKTPITIFLMKGVKLQGIITWFDNFSILLRRDGQTQLVYKHSISTILPSEAIASDPFYKLMENQKPKAGNLQDIFLYAVRDVEENVTIFLVNGVMLQGNIAAYDLFSILLERDNIIQLVYKHAVSTIQPDKNINLIEYNEDLG